MNCVKIGFLSFVIVIHATGMCSASTEKWQHVVDYFAARNLLPQNLYVKSEVTEESGEQIEYSELEGKLMLTGDDKVLFSVVGGTIDKKDVDEEDKEELSHIVPEEELTSLFPFDQAVAENIKFTDTDRCEIVGNTVGCRYTFTAEVEGKKIDGTVWLDENFSLPVQVEWQIRTVPFEEDDAAINRLHHVDVYSVSSNGDCLPVSSETEIDMEYSFFFFSKKIRILSTEEYSDYVERQALPINS